MLGEYVLRKLKTLSSPFIRDIRGQGLFIGMEIDPAKASARTVCEQLAHHGILSKETHEPVVRFAPPLVIEREDLDWAFTTIKEVLANMKPLVSAA